MTQLQRKNDNVRSLADGGLMKRFALLLAICFTSALAHAGGLPYAVESLKKAQELSRQDSSRHVMVFYTSEN